MVDQKRKDEILKRLSNCPVKCPVYVSEIANLSDFFGVFSALGLTNDHWYRGQPSSRFRLAPSALRYTNVDQRNRALNLVNEMRRYLEMRISKPPAANDHLAWLQYAQHHGIPTRLLDWTHNAAVALYFACSSHPDEDGVIFMLHPIELNSAANIRRPKIYNPQQDASVIEPYLKLDGSINSRGKPTIAINPTWNTERIALQQGAFTLHGSRNFDLDQTQTKSLVCVPILIEHKKTLLEELHRVGIGEMFIYPEPEHVCAHLRRMAEL